MEGLITSQSYVVTPPVTEWRENPWASWGHPSHYQVITIPAKMGYRNVARCPSCRAVSPSDALSVSVQLRASIGALFPAIVSARATVKRLASSCAAATEQQAAHALKLAPAKAERLAAAADLEAAKKRLARALAAEERDTAKDARLVKAAAGLKKELAAAEAALEELAKEKEQPGAAAGKKRKRA